MPIKLATSLGNGKSGLQAYVSLGLTGVAVVAAPVTPPVAFGAFGGRFYAPIRQKLPLVVYSLEAIIEARAQIEADLTIAIPAIPIYAIVAARARIEAMVVVVASVQADMSITAGIEARLARISPLDDQNDINDILMLSGFSRRD